MRRSEFLKMCTILGIGLPIAGKAGLKELHQVLGSNSPIEDGQKVLVIGAGAAGLTAAYLLNRKGIDVQVLEASNTYGGRMEANKEFTDFTLPLGAEWIHTTTPVMNQIVDDPYINVGIQTTPYDYTNDYAINAEGKRINIKKVGLRESDLRILNSSWIDFFEEYILTDIKDKISYNKVVKYINYTNDLIEVRTATETFTANRLIITIPVAILQTGEILFTPPLPSKKLKAIQKLKMHPGCKGFISFNERFYPTVIDLGSGIDGPRIYYDGAYGHDTNDNILGFAAIGKKSAPYLALKDPERIDFMLHELDELFDGKASKNYIKHVFKDWSADPFAKGAYNSSLNFIRDYRLVREMGTPIADKVYFAGDLYNDGNGWSTVHSAANGAKLAVQKILGNN